MIDVVLSSLVVYALASYALHALGVVVVVALTDEGGHSAGDEWSRNNARVLIRTWIVAPVLLPALFVRKAWRLAR